jgi:hypothetical protein|tara:strand:+ start:372 stop:488 length:117 start_codon:yes stop_codon:yes gene_type:complete
MFVSRFLFVMWRGSLMSEALTQAIKRFGFGEVYVKING